MSLPTPLGWRLCPYPICQGRRALMEAEVPNLTATAIRERVEDVYKRVAEDWKGRWERHIERHVNPPIFEGIINYTVETGAPMTTKVPETTKPVEHPLPIRILLERLGSVSSMRNQYRSEAERYETSAKVNRTVEKTYIKQVKELEAALKKLGYKG